MSTKTIHKHSTLTTHYFMDDHIHLTVASITEHQNKFLMVEEFSKKLKHKVINQPAGHVENNESIFDAVIRETLEETAWLVKPEAVIGIYQSFTDGNHDSVQYLRVCFSCSIDKQTDQALDSDIIQALWLSAEDILALKNARSPMVSQSLQDYLDGKRFSLDILTALR